MNILQSCYMDMKRGGEKRGRGGGGEEEGEREKRRGGEENEVGRRKCKVRKKGKRVMLE